MRFAAYFDRVFLITLESRPDRRRGAVPELQKLGLSFEDPKLEVFAARAPDSPGTFPSVGIRGCYESHLSVLQRAERRSLQRILVLEDDFALSPAFAGSEHALCADLAARPWDIVHFEYQPPQVADEAGTVARLVPFWRDTVGTACYGVHGRVLPRLVLHLQAVAARPPCHYAGGPMPVDGAINVFRWEHADVIRLLSIPAVAHQRPSRSDVTTPRWFDRAPVLRDVASAARSSRLVAWVRGRGGH